MPDSAYRWAVVISTSDSWTDYRHEADALGEMDEDAVVGLDALDERVGEFVFL